MRVLRIISFDKENVISIKESFVLLKCQPMLVSSSFIFVEVMFIKISENKNPLKITCYMVHNYIHALII